MAQWRDFLGRFRPAGAPGAASPRGVPANRIADVATELAPLFALLDDIHAEVEQIRSRAVAEAEALRAAGAAQAAATVAQARDRAESVAGEAADAVRARAAAEETALATAHAVALVRLRTRTAARMPGYVERVVTRARGLIAGSPVS